MENNGNNAARFKQHSFFTVLPVQPVLQDWIASIFILHWDYLDVPINNTYTYPWSATTHIFLTINDEPSRVKSPGQNQFVTFPGNVIIGPRLMNDVVSQGLSKHLVCIAFKPGGLHRLLGMPVSELVNQELDLSLVWSKQIGDLSERLKNAKDDREIFLLVNDFLLSKHSELKPISPFDQAIFELSRAQGNLPIQTVAELAGLNERQFERRAMTSLGIVPKLFARITRFTSAGIYKEAHPNHSWSQIAYTFGYADQMHLIDDFRKFTGVTPAAVDQRIRECGLQLFTALEGKV